MARMDGGPPLRPNPDRDEITASVLRAAQAQTRN
jgi:hypothetical protein